MTGSLKNGTSGRYLFTKPSEQERVIQGAISTSQAVRDLVECFIKFPPRNVFFGVCRSGILACLNCNHQTAKRRKRNPKLVLESDFRCSSNPIWNHHQFFLLQNALGLYSGIGTNTSGPGGWDSVSYVLKCLLEFCHYMMQPRGKIQSPRVLHSQRPIHPNGFVPYPRDLPSRPLYKANVLPLG